MTGYSRARFGPAWADTDGNHCDTRDDILKRDLRKVTFKTGSTCVIASGALHDPYTGKKIAFVRGVGTSTAVQIDHVVALADAWRTGAATGPQPAASATPTTDQSYSRLMGLRTRRKATMTRRSGFPPVRPSAAATSPASSGSRATTTSG